MRRLVCANLLGAALTLSLLSTPAVAQTPPPPDAERDTRPATTTASGATGLWFVPTSEVLQARRWSASFYRTNIDDGQGFTDVSTFPLTIAVGLGDRAELFGNWTLLTRIDRDSRPLFFAADASQDGTGGGIMVSYPLVRNTWIGNQLGDLWVGGKIRLGSPASKAPVGFAVRAMAKLPVGDSDSGASSGQADFQVDGIVSSFNSLAELSGFGGVIVRGNPDGFTLTNGFRWGLGAGFPQRYNAGFRMTAELTGEHYFDETITAPAGFAAVDGSIAPVSTSVKGPILGSVGVNWQAPNGFFIGAAASWNLGMGGREDAGRPNTPKDDKGLQIRIGFHPGASNRGAVLSAGPQGLGVGGPVAGGPSGPVQVSPPPPTPAPANRPPTVRAACDPCTVEVGRAATVSADAQDPDGNPLTYQWTAGAGSLASPSSRQSTWTAPNQEGPVVFTVTVNDGRGGTASDTVTIQVTRPAPRQYTFEDVHFEFDRFNLRTDALKILDDAVVAMQANANLRLVIEGHTCDIGTAEYNLALGERRAQAVLTYLVSRGISSDRLRTVSFGEERSKYDNVREETRRLNRRAALVVSPQ